MLLSIESVALELLLEHAVSASHLVGHIDKRAAASIVKELDEIVHTLTELPGNPCVVASPMRSVRLSLAPEVGVQKTIGAAVRSRVDLSRVSCSSSMWPMRCAADEACSRSFSRMTLSRVICMITFSALEKLLNHAASAAQLVGHLDDHDHPDLIGQLAHHVDTVVHGLTELLGEARKLVAPHTVAPGDRAVHDGAPMLTSSADGVP